MHHFRRLKPHQLKKVVFISNLPAPYQVKFCYELNKYYNTEFWFYEDISPKVGKGFWKMDLGDKCKIIPNVLFTGRGKYYTTAHLKMLKEFNPDVVMLGGLSIPANYLAYRWAKKHGKKTINLSEVSRKGLHVRLKADMPWKILKRAYRHIDAVFGMSPESYHQFRDAFGFGDKTLPANYGADIDKYFSHPTRIKKEQYTIIFANRLVEIYNPLGGLRIFNKVIQQYPEVKMLMNAEGDLKPACEAYINENNFHGKVKFLDDLKSWEDLNDVYKQSDILIIPAIYSNNNLTIDEAMASGMGIIVSNHVNGNGKFIKNGVNGYNIPLDEDLFAEKILAYIHNPGLFKIHEAYNRAFIKPYTFGETAKLYKKYIDTILP